MQVEHYSVHRVRALQIIWVHSQVYMFICTPGFWVHVLRDKKGASLVHQTCYFKQQFLNTCSLPWTLHGHTVPVMCWVSHPHSSPCVMNLFFWENALEDPETGDPGDSAILKCLPAFLPLARRHQNSPYCLLSPWGFSKSFSNSPAFPHLWLAGHGFNIGKIITWYPPTLCEFC